MKVSRQVSFIACISKRGAEINKLTLSFLPVIISKSHCLGLAKEPALGPKS